MQSDAQTIDGLKLWITRYYDQTIKDAQTISDLQDWVHSLQYEVTENEAEIVRLRAELVKWQRLCP